MEITPRLVDRSVPQEYVLRPLLWYMCINPIFNHSILSVVGITCYAGDTPIIAGGTSWWQKTRLMVAAGASVVSMVGNLGQSASIQKKEDLWLHGLPGYRPPPPI